MSLWLHKTSNNYMSAYRHWNKQTVRYAGNMHQWGGGVRCHTCAIWGPPDSTEQRPSEKNLHMKTLHAVGGDVRLAGAVSKLGNRPGCKSELCLEEQWIHKEQIQQKPPVMVFWEKHRLSWGSLEAFNSCKSPSMFFVDIYTKHFWTCASNLVWMYWLILAVMKADKGIWSEHHHWYQ